LGETGKGKLIGPTAEKVTFEDLATDLITDYQINKKRALRSVELSVRHLRKFFGMDRALQITADRVRLYVASRSVHAEKLASRPYIPRLKRTMRGKDSLTMPDSWR
jgi:hypothetical protein